MSVLLLATELYRTHGGVQAYMCRLAEILTDFAAARGTAFDCISLADSEAEPARHSRPVVYRTFRAGRGSKAAFVKDAVASRARAAVVGHPGLAPVAWALKRMRRVRRYVLVLHGVEAWKRADLEDRIGARAADLVVATTRFTASEFSKLNGVARERMRVVPLAVAEEQVEETASLSEAGALNILTVSRLSSVDTDYKGVDTLLDTVAKLRAEGVPATLTIVGSGDRMGCYQEYASRLGLNGAAVFAGRVADEDLPAYYRRCDVFAMPSKGEGFGIAFIEAMRHAKPCIGGNHGGTPEVIADGRDGYLVEHGDINRLASCLKQLWRDPQLRRRLGANGCRKVREKYLYPAMRSGWFAVLDEIL